MNDTVIHKLPVHLANQIAAGEVIQRPESVVKELIENALDAEADHVTLVVGQAGRNLIQVIDNGTGMSGEDLPLAFERHATSKIASLEDLERIRTFGFRGEALPSIAAVSQVEVKSKREGEELASIMRIEGGNTDESTKGNGEVGTTITVKNLFYNTPARRQFLKSNATEFRHINDTFQRYILSYPNVRWTFFNDGEPVCDLPPATIRDRLRVVFGEKTGESMIEVGESTNDVTVSGFVARPNFARKTRGNQYLFLNTRFIVHRAIQHAVISAYEQMIDSKEYPPFVVFLNLDPRAVDVNVHPSKLEAKFGNERMIYSLVHAIVRKGLYDHDLTPSAAFRRTGEGGGYEKLGLIPQRESSPRPSSTSSITGSAGSRSPDWTGSGGRPDEESINRLFETLELPAVSGKNVPTATEGAGEKERHEQQLLWQLHNKYILSPIKTGLMIVDQHVAHERILYERALSVMSGVFPFAQQLLFPHTIRMTAGDFALATELQQDLTRLGFILKLAPPNFCTVEAVPQDVRIGMEERILEEILEQYKEYNEPGLTDIRDQLAKSYACRGAIKAGDPLTLQEMQNLLDQLFATGNPYVCPHGRPVVLKLSLQEFDRRFGRSG